MSYQGSVDGVQSFVEGYVLGPGQLPKRSNIPAPRRCHWYDPLLHATPRAVFALIGGDGERQTHPQSQWEEYVHRYVKE